MIGFDTLITYIMNDQYKYAYKCDAKIYICRNYVYNKA